MVRQEIKESDRRLASQSAVSGFATGSGFRQFEILQHQKEELELQNRRLVEKVSKLRFSLDGN